MAMRRFWIPLALTATLAAGPAWAGQDSKPITNRDPDAVDVIKTPLTDLNIDRKGEIPQILTDAETDPYSLTGLHKCRELTDAVGQLDDVLGPDLDLPQATRSRISEGRLAKTVVSSFIPFRGVIREISGANDKDRQVRAAIQAGLARRGFLKGVGRIRGCRYPARPASAKDVADYEASIAASKADKDSTGKDSTGKDKADSASKD